MLDEPDAFPADFVVIPIDLVPEVLTPEPVRLLGELRRHGPYESVNDLAAALGRDQSRVSRDVARLAGPGLVEVETVGRRRRVRAGERVIVVA